MNMNISNWKIALKYVFGGVSSVVEYLLEILNKALASLTDATKTKVQAVLNIALKVLSVLKAIQFLVPTKWQTAYVLTVEAVEYAVEALKDLNVTAEEASAIAKKVAEAYDAWRSPDDETCVTLECVNGVYQIA